MKIGFTCGAFDLLHPGHLHLLEWSKRHCDRLIVGLHTDPSLDRPDTKNRPIQTTFERWQQLMALRDVDEIIPYDTEQDLLNLLATLEIHIRFVGEDYLNHQKFTGQELCRDRKITILYAPRTHSYSSTELRKRVWAREWKQH